VPVTSPLYIFNVCDDHPATVTYAVVISQQMKQNIAHRMSTPIVPIAYVMFSRPRQNANGLS